MNCPHCATPIGEHVTEYGDHACAACGLAGPREVLEVLAARLAPAGILGEAERLLRAADVCDVWLDNDGTNVSHWVVSGDEETYDSATHPTLAAGYEKLTKGDAHG